MYLSINYTRYLSKFAGFVLGVVQYGCITHCTLEYIGDFVVVRCFCLEKYFKYKL